MVKNKTQFAAAASFRTTLGTVLAVAFALNWLWESAQLSAYAGHTGISVAARFIHCFPATVADAVFIAGLYAGGFLFFRNAYWIYPIRARRYAVVVLIGAGVATVVEHLALEAGRWSYGPAMPQLPWLGVGLLPLAQLSFLPAITFASVAQWRKKASPDEKIGDSKSVNISFANTPKQARTPEASSMLHFAVIGESRINCGACEKRISDAMASLPGIREVQASARTQQVALAIDPAQVDSDQVKSRMEQLGYQVKLLHSRQDGV